MDYRKIQKIADLKDLNPASLFEQDNFESVKYYACDCIDGLDWDEAVAFSRVLEDKIEQVSPSTREDQYKYMVFWFWIFKLKLFAFGSLSSGEKSDLIKSHAAKMLGLGLDVKGFLMKPLDIFESVKAIQDEIKDISFALHNSLEVLGNNAQAFERQNFKPTVSNWLKEYQIVQRADASGVKIEPGAFHIVKFMDTSPYIKLLSKEEKQTLKDLLDLYNWLLSPVLYTEQIKESVNEEFGRQASPYMNKQEFLLPSENLNTPGASSKPVIQKSVVPPQVPTPASKESTTRVEMNEIMGGQVAGSRQQESSKGQELNKAGAQTAQEAKGRIAQVLPDYKKPIPSAVINSETLAKQMTERKNQVVSSKNQGGEQRAQQSADISNQSADSRQQTTEPKVPTKAELFVQKEIDQKLHSLEEKARNKNNS